MALFIGRDKSTADLITRNGVPMSIIDELGDRYLRPMIGELRYQLALVDVSSLQPKSNGVYIPTKDFNGWTYPDGKRLNKRNFPEAFDEYGVTGSNTFEIPNIVDPIRSIGLDVGSKKGLNRLDKNADVPRHNHAATNDINGQFETCEIKIPGGLAFYSASGHDITKTLYEDYKINGTTISLPRFHGGEYNEDSSIPVPLDIHLKFKDLGLIFGGTDYQTSNPLSIKDNTQNIGVDDPNVQLEHLTMPIAIYIGKPVI